jgi:hypothetical protein
MFPKSISGTPTIFPTSAKSIPKKSFPILLDLGIAWNQTADIINHTSDAQCDAGNKHREKKMNMRKISNEQMARYWAERVAELEAMRPITATEAIAEADRLEAQAEVLEASVAAAEQTPRETGRVASGDTVQARDQRNAMAVGDARRAVWGNTTRALNCRDRAKALRRVAGEEEGTALAASLAEARQRAEYYAGLCAR